MILITLDLSTLLHSQYIRLKAQAFKLDQSLAERYGQRYTGTKQKMDGAQDWYQKAKSEAQSSGTIPLQQKQKETDRQFAKAGSTAARKEQAIKRQLKELWHTITKS